jgi:hypothetical protein
MNAEEVLARPSLLEVLRRVPDPRRREGRVYPLASILAMLILASVNGESSLRGMLMWADAHWAMLVRELGFKPTRKAPVYGGVWRLLAALDPAALEQALAEWSAGLAAEAVAVSLDGKQLRGSKRAGLLPALQVVSAAAQTVGVVVGQASAADGDMVAGALAVLQGLPLEGKVVTMDAGLLQKRVVDTVLAKGGPVWGC